MTQNDAYFDPRKVVEQRLADAAASAENEALKLMEEEKRQKNIKTGAKAMGVILGWAVKPAVLALVWNWVIPPLFGLATLSYWTAFGICIITTILFKNDTSNDE